MCVLYIDTRQQAGKHAIKDTWFNEHGVMTERRKLDFGDYSTDKSNRSVDTKRNIDEIAQNINGKNHDRFKRECVRAREAGYRLIILVENRDSVYSLEGLQTWTNGHCSRCVHFRTKSCNPHEGGKCQKHGTRKPIQGERLARAMSTMSERYGVQFAFCPPHDAARIICKLLGVEYKLICKDCYRYVDGACLPVENYHTAEGGGVAVDGLQLMCDRGCPF